MPKGPGAADEKPRPQAVRLPEMHRCPSPRSSLLVRSTVAFFATLVLTTSPSVVAQSDSYGAAREQFLAAWSEVGRTTGGTSVADSTQLQAYPLYPYLQAARLQRELSLQRVPTSTAGMAESETELDLRIQSLLQRSGDQPAMQDLRTAWLTSLASRSLWQRYLTNFNRERDAGPELRCNAYTAAIALGRTNELEAQISETWLTPKSLPAQCDTAFEWLRARNQLTPNLIERRARAALAAGEAGLARRLAGSLPAPTAAPLLQWASLIEQPRTALEALIANPDRPVEPQALNDGWSRFARADTDAAAARLPALIAARRLDARSASPLEASLGLQRALSRDPRALDHFGRAAPQALDERAHEWHVRAAVWAGDWARVGKAVDSMPAELRNQPRWRYWSARAAEQLGDRSAAQQGYAAVIPTDNWYAALAAARLGRAFTPNLQSLSVSDRDVDRLAPNPGFVRTSELLRCNLQPQAANEWRAAFEGLPAGQQPAALVLAARWGWHFQTIASAAKLRIFNDYDLLYPRPFDGEVRLAAQRTGLAQELIYAILRQESLYRADVRSSAGALGLMQLLPETARQTANRWDLPEPTRSSLLIPSVNIPLGAATLQSLISRAAGQIPLAIAGYNAGPGAARRWLPASPMEADRWVENIPYNETRAYVQKVAWHSVVFGWLDERKPQDVTRWLTQIRAPAVDAALSPAR